MCYKIRFRKRYDVYGDKVSKAILSNLSYQFFGKVNDPDTAKYYERFFKLVKRGTTSINMGYNLNFDTRITRGEKEVSKQRADIFFMLKPREFIAFADDKDKILKFKHHDITRKKELETSCFTKKDVEINFNKIHDEIKLILK